MEHTYHTLADEILKRATAALQHHGRYLVAIAGAPGSGKTTTAKHVVDIINSSPGDTKIDNLSKDQSSGPGSSTTSLAVCISMDGFHLSRAVLDKLPNREEAYRRRGAPWTFDVNAVVGLVRELRDSASAAPTNQLPRRTIFAPSFDHAVKDPVENGIEIPFTAQIIILEGNYLLLDEEGWREIAGLVDLRVFIDVDLERARTRVAERHVRAGIERTLEDAYRRVDGNDYLNGVLIKERLMRPDVVVESVEDAGMYVS